MPIYCLNTKAYETKHSLPFHLFEISLIIFLFFPLKSQGQVKKSDKLNTSNTQGFNFGCADCDLQIYPKQADFTSGNEGKVIISTRNDDNAYHSSAYQTSDQKLTLKVVMHESCAGEAVYFKVIDPDDRSPYESDEEPNDNLDMSNNAGTFGGNIQAVVLAVKGMFNGQIMAIAEVELTITNRYAGDNYQIIASLDNTFPEAETVKSMEFIAWKRFYVEVDLMYRYGATIIKLHEPDLDDLEDWLEVDNIDDFTKGQTISLFSPHSSIVINTTLLEIDETNNRIQIPDLNTEFLAFSGVKIDGINTVVNYSNEFFTQGFGEDPKGTDCGAFVEILDWNYGENSLTPKYKSFPSSSIARLYMGNWFSQQGTSDNVFYLLGAIQAGFLDNTGYADLDNNHTIYFEGKIGLVKRKTWIAELINHEIGHHCGVDDNNRPNSHYHDDPIGGKTCPIDGIIDQCVMSYGGDFRNGIAKFDNEDFIGDENCHFLIRKIKLPR